mmetsp:Transcript_3388/g.7638  ORF Transcript_3388/g.7638 Transcript_3388/m.7638 type:complete len:720 (+) Transcript_3388:188-2347(+)
MMLRRGKMKSISTSIVFLAAFQSINAFVPPSSSLTSSSTYTSSSKARSSESCSSPTRLFVSREGSRSRNDSRYNGGRSGRGEGRRSTGARGQVNKREQLQIKTVKKIDGFEDYEDDEAEGYLYTDDYDGYEQAEDDFNTYNNFVTFEDDDDDDYYYDEDDFDSHDSQQDNSFGRNSGNTSNGGVQESRPNNIINGKDATASSTFYSKKSLSDPSFSASSQFFQLLCRATKITRPSRIQSLAWPVLLRGENAIVADQTGSGKTLAYLLPLLQKIHQLDMDEEQHHLLTNAQRKKAKVGSPRVVILTPTAELADQIHSVCTNLSKNLSSLGGDSKWNFYPFVTTATGSHSTNIRDQIRRIQSTPIDVLISTPGRLATILRTKNAGLDLSQVQSLVLDEVDFLLVDETFGPQLRTVGVAVNQDGNPDIDANDSEPKSKTKQAQFVFVTATLPDDVLASIKTEFPGITELRGPGLHRITPSVHQTLVDVSVPATSNRNPRACFDIKVREMFKALRSRRCAKTLIFCNTVETCRSVENVLRRDDRKRKRNRVWAYHNALTPEVRLKNLHSFSQNGGGDDGKSHLNDGTERILVCTDRAARGIDFESSPIDHVLLFDFPKDPAEYVRRVGRTARAGREGASTVLAYGWQLPIARQIMGIGGDGKKGKKNKRGKLESFTMMKSNAGWGEEELEDEFYMKGGARRRMDIAQGKVKKGKGSNSEKRSK